LLDCILGCALKRPRCGCCGGRECLWRLGWGWIYRYVEDPRSNGWGGPGRLANLIRRKCGNWFWL